MKLSDTSQRLQCRPVASLIAYEGSSAEAASRGPFHDRACPLARSVSQMPIIPEMPIGMRVIVPHTPDVIFCFHADGSGISLCERSFSLKAG